MEFFFAVFFLLFYYLRPQDWVTGLIGLNLVKPIIAIWLGAIVMGRSVPSPLPGLLRTPHDWIILSYFIYVVWTAPDMSATFSGFLPLVVFYALTVQSITSWERLESYLKWWMVALIILSIIANLIPLGIDLTGGKAYMEHHNRLCIGTWMHGNPNALAHSVAVVMPISYLLFFWKGTSLGKWVYFPLSAGLAYWCVFQTESKGGFLVGAICLASIYVIGRPKFIQVAVVVISLTVGMSALTLLPRMAQMNDLRSDEGVQGRLLAWEAARASTKNHSTGVGWNQFLAVIDWKDGNRHLKIEKATHSSYVQVGADLGRYGLLLYVAGLWCCLHTLLRFKPANDDEDRCRRILAVLLLSTVVSGWMINRQYHTEYFLLIAATAALHRLRVAEEAALLPAVETSAGDRNAHPAAPNDDEYEYDDDRDSEAGSHDERGGEEPKEEELVPAFSTGKEAEEEPPKPFWNRFGMRDLAICVGLTYGTFWFWDYIIANL